MGTIVGSGDYTYRVEEGWGKLPPGWAFGDVAAVGTDARDNVYVFNRSAHPMVVFDRAGNFLRSWGEGIRAWHWSSCAWRASSRGHWRGRGKFRRFAPGCRPPR